MSGYISRFSIASIILSSLALFACSSDDDSAAGALVPPNAVTITEANAKGLISQATVGGSALLDTIPISASVAQAPAAGDIINLVVDKAKSLSSTPQLNIPVGEVIEIPCDSGSITFNGTETATGASGTMTLDGCILGTTTLGGTIAISVSFNESTGAWTVTMSGNISGTDSGVTTSLSGLAFNQTGNDNTYEFSINIYTFALDFTGGGGFLVQLTSPIVGNEMEFCPNSPRSGIVLVTGADATRARGTINNNGTVTVEFDNGSGAFVEVTEPAPGSPYLCIDFFS